MNMPNREHYVKCFFAGGLVLGLLSGIPIIGAGNCFCCMWVVLGGGLAGYLLVRWSAFPVSAGEGALVGMLSGAFGAVISSILNALQQMVLGQDYYKTWQDAMYEQRGEMPPGFEEAMEHAMEIMTNPAIYLTMTLIVSLVLFSIFAMVGGLLAVSIWGPRKFPPYGHPPGTYPPGYPAPGYGGPGVYIPPPVMPQPGSTPPVAPPESKRFPGSDPGQGQGSSGPLSPG
jgi:hypothetical protein